MTLKDGLLRKKPHTRSLGEEDVDRFDNKSGVEDGSPHSKSTTQGSIFLHHLYVPHSSSSLHGETRQPEYSAQDMIQEGGGGSSNGLGQDMALASIKKNNQCPVLQDLKPKSAQQVTWMSLPRKDQLIILTLARLSEPLAATSLQAYMFYQLKSFNPELPDSTISAQAGILQGIFPATQVLTAILLGRVADAEWGGRKIVLLTGMLGTGVSCIGFGFSKTFLQAVIYRSLGGALNGNVGVIRTMVSEIIKEKKYQSRAFLILPVTFNIGIIIGPILGGLLADPVNTYPSIFGPGSFLGGKSGAAWMMKWPYALPNLLSAVFYFWSALGCFLFLEETLEARKDYKDYGLRLGRGLVRIVKQSLVRQPTHQYHSVASEDSIDANVESSDLELQPHGRRSPGLQDRKTPKRRLKLPFRRIWTFNVLSTFLVHSLLALHVSTFNSLWFVFLATPRFDPNNPEPSGHRQRLPFGFTGGLSLPPPSIGLALAILGVIGIIIQLFVYPTVSFKLGTVKSYRMSLLIFPIAYALVPYLAVVPSRSAPPHQADGILVWLAMTGVLFIQVIARTFALPAGTILINNCTPHPSVLGTVHGVALSVTSFVRSVGPILFGLLYGVGLHKGIIGMAWWTLSLIAICCFLTSGLLYEGDGHEIVLEEDDRKPIDAQS